MELKEKSDRVAAEIRGALGISGMTRKALAYKLRWTRDKLNRRLRNPSMITINELEEICKALEMTITFGRENKKWNLS